MASMVSPLARRSLTTVNCSLGSIMKCSLLASVLVMRYIAETDSPVPPRMPQTSRGNPSLAWAIKSSWIAWGIRIMSGHLQIADSHGIQFILDLGDGRVITADRTGGFALERHLAKFHPQGAVGQQTVGKKFPLAQQKFDSFGCLDGTDDTGQHTDHTGLGAAGNGVLGGRFRKDAAITGRFVGLDRDGLAVELQDAAMGVRLAGQDTGVVDQEFCGKVVGAVDNEIIINDNLVNVGR